MTCDMWHGLGEKKYFEDIFTKDDWVNQSISNEVVCKTAPTTPGLLNIINMLNIIAFQMSVQEGLGKVNCLPNLVFWTNIEEKSTMEKYIYDIFLTLWYWIPDFVLVHTFIMLVKFNVSLHLAPWYSKSKLVPFIRPTLPS